MLEHWLIQVIGHFSGLSDAQLKQIEKSLPATKALVDLLNRARPIIEQAQNLYTEAEPLIDEAKREWETVGPAAQILIDVISHHVDRGSSPAVAAKTVRAALNGSINSVAEDRLTDQGMSCATVFGGTGFVGRRVVRHLRDSGTRVRAVSRHRAPGEDAGIEQIAADAHDQRSVEAYPVFGDGRTRLQPVYVDDVATAIAQILRQSQKPYPDYELAGPRVYSYEELLRTIARIAGLRPVLMRMPFAFWNALAGVAEMLPRPPFTRNQVELMQIDTAASKSLPGFRALGISPRSLEDELEAIVRPNKPRVLLR